MTICDILPFLVSCSEHATELGRAAPEIDAGLISAACALVGFGTLLIVSRSTSARKEDPTGSGTDGRACTDRGPGAAVGIHPEVSPVTIMTAYQHVPREHRLIFKPFGLGVWLRFLGPLGHPKDAIAIAHDLLRHRRTDVDQARLDWANAVVQLAPQRHAYSVHIPLRSQVRRVG